MSSSAPSSWLHFARSGAICLLVLLPLFGLALVPTVSRAAPKAEIVDRLEALPAPVLRMREALLTAAASGDIERLREPLEMNELMPVIDGELRDDPISYWKSVSSDGSGRELLARLIELLSLPPARIRSNDRTDYVWPYFAEQNLSALTPTEIVSLYRIVPASEAAVMLKGGRYTYFRLDIGADGTWHFMGRPVASKR